MSAIVVAASERRVVRRAVRIPCELVADRGFRLLGRAALDVSLDGILVRAEADAELGEDVIVAFRGPRSRMWFDALGRVARLVHGRRPTDGGRAIAVRFEALDAATRVVLAAKLDGLPPPLPARRVRRDYVATLCEIGAR